MTIETIHFQPGDIIFTAIPNALYRKVAQSTGTWTSHVGVVYDQIDGVWMVAESTVPFSTLTPAEQFISKTDNGKFAVKRFGELDDEQVGRLQSSIDMRMGKLYNLGFDYHATRQFCSKFVFDVYKEAMDVKIGDIETFGQLLEKNPNESLLFWRFYFFGLIPWQRETVSPASIYLSNQLKTVIDVTQHSK